MTSNKHLKKALCELEDLEAENIPSEEEILGSQDNSQWSGPLKGGGDWKLIKNGEDSFTTNTRVMGK